MAMMSLFDDLKSTREGIPEFDSKAPLAVRMRPQTLDEFIDQNNNIEPGSPIEQLLDPNVNLDDAPAAIILWGPPGTGKTTLAYLISRATTGESFIELSAVSDGVKEVRSVIDESKNKYLATKKRTVLFIDEIHRFSKSQQDTLLPAVENKWITLIAATTENPSFAIISPLLSRGLVTILDHLDETDIKKLINNALESEKGLNKAFTLEENALNFIVKLSGGDARKALTLLEASTNVSKKRKSETITEEDVSKAANVALARWDTDQHYDVASAFIKSMRGSDPDATLHYLARMIQAGEDPRFIARRIMIAASEDVGLADSRVLSTTVSAAQAVAMIGAPESNIVLSHAALAVAMAPKSNSAYMGIKTALEDLDKGLTGRVPNHLRDSHYSGAKKLGHGEGYKYPHDYSNGVVEQQYLPDEIKERKYFLPTSNGNEKHVSEKLEKLNDKLNRNSGPIF